MSSDKQPLYMRAKVITPGLLIVQARPERAGSMLRSFLSMFLRSAGHVDVELACEPDVACPSRRALGGE